MPLMALRKVSLKSCMNQAGRKMECDAAAADEIELGGSRSVLRIQYALSPPKYSDDMYIVYRS